MDALRPAHKLWATSDPTYTGWLFRGHASSAWELVPSAFRSSPVPPLLRTYQQVYGKKYVTDRGYRYEQWLKWIKPEIPTDITPRGRERVESAALQALAQAALLRDYMLLADRAGHPTRRPDFLWHLEGHDEDTLSLSEFFNGKPSVEVSSFAIAQHHGIPTGLLDWTYNPLVAAFFASEDYADPRASSGGGTLSVWALRTHVFRRELKELRRVTLEPGRVPFLDAQDGLFTWNPQAFRELATTGATLPINAVIERLESEGLLPADVELPLLREFRLPVSEGPALQGLLWREQITRAHLMPTFDNVAVSLRSGQVQLCL